jgi:addiction module RelE/StbE family toxin
MKISQKAQSDLSEIYDYIKDILNSPKAAEDLNKNFECAFQRLNLFPESGLIYKNNYRKLFVENYIAFYKIDEKEKNIIIYRILYAHSNYKKIL